MRDLTTSLLSFAWAQTLYTIQQMADIGKAMARMSMPEMAHPPAPGVTPIPVMMPELVIRPSHAVAAPVSAQPVPAAPGIAAAVSPQAPGWGPMP